MSVSLESSEGVTMPGDLSPSLWTAVALHNRTSELAGCSVSQSPVGAMNHYVRYSIDGAARQEIS
jgi:hypothetical protein